MMSQEKIKEFLKKMPQYEVSESKNSEILNALASLEVTGVKNTTNINIFIYLTHIFMENFKKYGAIVVVLVGLLFIGGNGLFGQVTYAHHLDKAEEALAELQELNNEGTDADDDRVQELLDEIVSETEAALTLAEKDLDGEELEEALSEIEEVQGGALEAFDASHDLLEDDDDSDKEGVDEEDAEDSDDEADEESNMEDDSFSDTDGVDEGLSTPVSSSSTGSSTGDADELTETDDHEEEESIKLYEAADDEDELNDEENDD